MNLNLFALEGHCDEAGQLIIPPAGPKRDDLLADVLGIRALAWSSQPSRAIVLVKRVHRELGPHPSWSHRQGNDWWRVSFLNDGIHCDSSVRHTMADALTRTLLRALELRRAEAKIERLLAEGKVEK